MAKSNPSGCRLPPVIDLRLMRENPAAFQEGAARKHVDVDVGEAVELDAAARKQLAAIEELRAQRKTAGKEMANADAAGKEAILAAQSERKEEIQRREAEHRGVAEALQELLLRIPNPPLGCVPDGKTDEDNALVREMGDVPAADETPRDHVDLGAALGVLDIPRAAAVAGSRNYALLGDGALLERAILDLGFSSMLEIGFLPVNLPVLVRDSAMEGTGYFPGGEDQAYRVPQDGMSLAGTGEVPLTALYGGEIFDEMDLPIRLVTETSCYRREAGAAGRDTRGLYRVHQFRKVEQVVLGPADDAWSAEMLEEIVGNAERVMAALEVPWRVVDVCAGDLGAPPVRKLDIEAWMPSRGSYGETHSASAFHEYQARRLGLRYRDSSGKVRFCHTLNGTVVATPRTVIAVLECHQRPDGSVGIPGALHAAFGGRTVIEPGRAPAPADG